MYKRQEWDVTFHEAETEVLSPLVQGDGLLQLMQKNLPAERAAVLLEHLRRCLLYTSPSPRDRTRSRMPSSA